jgi:hypothetical protein
MATNKYMLNQNTVALRQILCEAELVLLNHILIGRGFESSARNSHIWSNFYHSCFVEIGKNNLLVGICSLALFSQTCPGF